MGSKALRKDDTKDRVENRGLRLIKQKPDTSLSSHHVPPRRPARFAPFKLKKTLKDHRAYHQLFRNAGSYEQCCEILKREWWTNPAEQQQEVI